MDSNKCLLILFINLIIFCNFIFSIENPNHGTFNGAQYYNGINAGYKPGWSNEKLSPLLSRAGLTNSRISFPCTFFDTWGYNIYYDNNSIKSLRENGQSNFTAFITYSQSDGAIVPSSIYEDIWSSQGVVNTNNVFAVCVQKIVQTYKEDIKIIEVYNEPDYVNDWTVVASWATTAPTDAQLSRFNGDIYSYIRLLRIVWEVSKYIDPTIFVTVGGLGYPLFFDAVLRYSDSATSTTGKKGIDYIDVLSTHFYPIYATKSNNSDSYMAAYTAHQNTFKQVCTKYNWTPSLTIVTEVGVQTSSGGGYYGSSILARNFFLKLPTYSILAGVNQNHIFVLPDTNGTNPSAHDLMGLYYDYANSNTANIKDSTKALKTWYIQMNDKTYNNALSTTLKTLLPGGVIGHVYSNSTNNCLLLWANSIDQNVDENTPSKSIKLDADGDFKIFDYLNNYSVVNEEGGQVTLTLTSTPIFVYGTNEDLKDPNSVNNSLNLFNLLNLNLLIFLLLITLI